MRSVKLLSLGFCLVLTSATAALAGKDDPASSAVTSCPSGQVLQMGACFPLPTNATVTQAGLYQNVSCDSNSAVFAGKNGQHISDSPALVCKLCPSGSTSYQDQNGPKKSMCRFTASKCPSGTTPVNDSNSVPYTATIAGAAQCETGTAQSGLASVCITKQHEFGPIAVETPCRVPACTAKQGTATISQVGCMPN